MRIILSAVASLLILAGCAHSPEMTIKLGEASRESVLEMDGYFVWGASMTRDDDGLYHIFFSRWKKEYGFNSWVTHSEIAHAVGSDPFGAFEFKDVALPARGAEYWDGLCTHNPTILRIGDKYYLYYMGNTGDGAPSPEGSLNWTHRNNQRIGVAVADSPYGPWRRSDKPLIDVGAPEDSDALMTSNPAVSRMADGRMLMVYKAVGLKRELPFGGPVVHLAAVSDSPEGPFEKYEELIFTLPGDDFPAEDPFIWCDGRRYHAVVKDQKGGFTGVKGHSLALFESEDGLHWGPAANALISDTTVHWADGDSTQFHNLERPQIYFENGRPLLMLLAACPRDTTGQITHTFNLRIPILAR